MHRILFVIENVTLAQVVRSVILGSSLDPRRFQVHAASAAFEPLIFDGTPFVRHTIASLPAAQVERAVMAGRRVYDERTLRAYVRDELTLFERVQPALVIGDLRWSLSTSCALAQVPYAAIINSYWHPQARLSAFPMPEHPLVRFFGVERAAAHYPRLRPRVFARVAEPVNALRRRHGLSSIGSLSDVLCHGDLTLFPDVPSLPPIELMPPNACHLGPVLWSPKVPLPADMERLGRDNTALAYVTMGSSGALAALDPVIAGLRAAGFDVLCSLAGRRPPRPLPPEVITAALVPGQLAARRADLVVSSGGASTAHQALAEGRPVLAVPYNLDQYLAAQALVDRGAGLMIRAGTITAAEVASTARRLLDDARFGEQARAVAAEMRSFDAVARFAAVVERVVGTEPADGRRRHEISHLGALP